MAKFSDLYRAAVSAIGGVVASLPFNESSGTVASDYSGNGHSGTYTPNSGGSWTGGTLGSLVSPAADGSVLSASFGSSGYVTIPNNSAFWPTNFSAGVWVNITTLPSAGAGYGALYCLEDGTSNDIASLYVKNNGKLAIYFKGASGTTYYDGTGTNTLGTGQWYYLSVTYDAVNGLKGYVNGVQDGSAGAKGALVAGTTPITVNLDTYNAGRTIAGYMNNLDVFSGVVTQAQWGGLYNTMSQAVTTPTTGHLITPPSPGIAGTFSGYGRINASNGLFTGSQTVTLTANRSTDVISWNGTNSSNGVIAITPTNSSSGAVFQYQASKPGFAVFSDSSNNYGATPVGALTYQSTSGSPVTLFGTNLKAWYRNDPSTIYADAGTTLAIDGQGVYQWNDQSGNNNHATNNVGGNQLVYHAQGPSMLVPGSAAGGSLGYPYHVTTPSLSLDQQNSSGWVVVMPHSQLQLGYLMCQNGSNFGMVIGGYNGSNVGTTNTHNDAGSNWGMDRVIIGFSSNASGWTFFVNGYTKTLAALPAGVVNQPVQILAYLTGTLYATPLTLYEAGIINRAITPAEIASLVNYATAQHQIPVYTEQNRVAFLGDSITNGPPNLEGWSFDCLFQLNKTKGYNYGYIGFNTSQLSAIVPQVAYQLMQNSTGITTAVCYAGGVNDPAGGMTWNQTIANMQSAAGTLKTAGVNYVFTRTLGPRIDSSIAAVAAIHRVQVNAYLRANYRAIGFDALVDDETDPLIGNVNQSYYGDNLVHPNGQGHMIIAAHVANAIRPYLQAQTYSAPGSRVIAPGLRP